jgi:hypothetical protein
MGMHNTSQRISICLYPQAHRASWVAGWYWAAVAPLQQLAAVAHHSNWKGAKPDQAPSLFVLSSLLRSWPLHYDVITAFVASYSIFVHLGHDVHID